MNAKFISHPDFAELAPVNVFHKEHTKLDIPKNPTELLNRHILYRKKLTLDTFEKAILKISADDHYKLYINGAFVCEGPAPSYIHAYYYNEIDVSKYLKPGENTVAVHTYYQGMINRVWVSSDLRQMLYFSLGCDGKTVCVSDESWKIADHTGYTECGTFGYDTAFAEHYDNRSLEEKFYLPDFDDSSWGYAKEKKIVDYKLVKQPTTVLTYENIAPAVLKRENDKIFIDFGREAVGYLYAKASGKAGDTLILRYGEELNDDGSVRHNLRCNCVYEEKWTVSDGVCELSQYDYKAFRYAEITVPDGVKVDDIKLIARYYPYEQKAKYLENKELEPIIKLCADTVKYGTQEGYVDCPTREKGQYLGDVSIAARAHAVLTGDTSMMKKAIRDFCRSDFICPGIMAVSTSALMQEIADYSLQFPAQICWVYAMDGDREFLEFTKPYIDAELKFFLKYANSDGLLDGVTSKWNLVDWPANLRDGYDFPLTKPVGAGVHNVLNAFWIGFLKSCDELYGLLGLPATGLTEKAEAAYIKYFYNSETGLFCDTKELTHSSIHSNVLPLLFDVCKDEQKARIVDFIMEKRLTSMGVYMAYFTLAALMKNGCEKEALELTLDDGAWKLMLSEGATTTFEAWGKDQKWNTSLFHPWATAPAIIFAKNTRIY